MSFITKVFALFMSLLLSLLGTTGITVHQKAKALRVVAYIIADNVAMMDKIDESHLDVLTGTILTAPSSIHFWITVSSLSPFGRA